MDIRKRREIVERELTNKISETGCFVKYSYLKEKCGVYEYQWDFIKMCITESVQNVKIEVRTMVGVDNIAEMEGGVKRYSYATEAEFLQVIKDIYDKFKNLYFPEANRLVEEALESGKQLGNQQTMEWLSSQLASFQEENKNRSDKDTYDDIVNMRIQAYEKYSSWIKAYYMRASEEERVKIITEVAKEELLATILFGEWVIKTQGGRWKTNHRFNGYNKCVLVHPQNEDTMVDIKCLLDQRCKKRNIIERFSYSKDKAFWRHNR